MKSEQEPNPPGAVVGVLVSLIVAAAATGVLLALDAGTTAAALVGTLVLVWALLKERRIRQRSELLQPVTPEELAEAGLGVLPPGATAKDLYLDTVKRTLMNIIYHESSDPMWRSTEDPARCIPINALHLDSRTRGADFATNSLTLLGTKRLDNIQHCVESILDRGIPGDFIETGAFKGGGCIYMKAVLRANESAYPGGQSDRRVFVCDTFADAPRPPHLPGWLAGQAIVLVASALASIPVRGWRRSLVKAVSRGGKSFPPVGEPSDHLMAVATIFMRRAWEFNPIGGGAVVTGGLENVRSHFARFGLLDDGIVFLKGFFADTLPAAPIERLALLRTDCDTYESTMDALRPLYDRLVEGGFCIIDDYFEYPECKKAVDEFRAERGIADPIQQIDWNGAFWIKGGADAETATPR